MTARPPFLIAAATVALVSAYLLGRASAPTRTVETVSVQRTTRIEYRERTDSASTLRTNEIAVVGPTLIRTRWLECPKGPGQVVEQTVERGPVETRKETSADLTVKTHKERLLTATEATLQTRIVQRDPPRWGVGVGGGLRFHDAAALVSGSFEVRALGPFHVQAFAVAPARKPSDFTAGLQLVWRGP